MEDKTYFEDGQEMVGPGYPLAQYVEETDPANFPVALTLRFKTPADKRRFLAMLLDSSVGENDCSVHWRWMEGEKPDETVATLNVTLFEEETIDPL